MTTNLINEIAQTIFDNTMQTRRELVKHGEAEDAPEWFTDDCNQWVDNHLDYVFDALSEVLGRWNTQVDYDVVVGALRPAIVEQLAYLEECRTEDEAQAREEQEVAMDAAVNHLVADMVAGTTWKRVRIPAPKRAAGEAGVGLLVTTPWEVTTLWRWDADERGMVYCGEPSGHTLAEILAVTADTPPNDVWVR